MDKILIIVRHAHRNVVNPHDDNGLSEKGLRQAKAIKKYFEKRYGKRDVEILSSPKLRCRETLEPIVEFLGAKMNISPLLDEGTQSKFGTLEKRVLEFKKWWIDKASDFVLISSHGDWIPSFFEVCLGKSTELKKAGWATLKLTDADKISVEEIIQSWD